MRRPNIAGMALRLAVGYIAVQAGYVLYHLFKADTTTTLLNQKNEATPGVRYSSDKSETAYTVKHTVEDGIERVVYTPTNRQHETPILMQHGMWHGGWTWEFWQPLFAEWGWESHAVSLPGHGLSDTQRPIHRCTLDYYLSFLKREVERLPRKPVLMGHSMGGALTQWYLKHVGDNLAAAVLVAPWGSHSTLKVGAIRLFQLDPMGMLLTSLMWSATPWMRTPEHAARKLVSEEAVLSPEELHMRLGPESALVLMQHNPPFWSPPDDVKTPMLLVAGEKDTMIGTDELKRSAKHYHAQYIEVPGAGHNVMMERSYRQTAHQVHDWLESLNLR